MRGRLTIETVNAALDEAASHCEANSKLMAAVRSNTVKAADRKRGTILLHCVAVSLLDCWSLCSILLLKWTSNHVAVLHRLSTGSTFAC